MRKDFKFYYRFDDYQYWYGLRAEDLVEAKLKAQRQVDEWNRLRGPGRVLEWVEEIK